MTQITDGKLQLELETTKEQVTVRLEANQYVLNESEQFKNYLTGDALFLEGEITSISDEQMILSYRLPEYAESLPDVLSSLDDLGRLELARKLSVLNVQDQVIIPFLHPNNLFLVAGSLRVAHRGITDLVKPYVQSKEDFLRLYQSLVISTVLPKYRFESLASGKTKLRDAFSQEIFGAESFEAIHRLIEKQYRAAYLERHDKEKLVKKGRYSLYKWAAGFFVILAAVLGVWLAITLGSTLPKQEQITSSETHFIQTNYDQVTTDLQAYAPEGLPKSAQYVLAASFIHLENLTNDQKTTILNNLSMNSSPNELLYWIYIGRGNFNKALSIAQNIGDDQLILHAYTKLYDATNANTSMSGAQKQSLLNQYKQQIDKYVKLLGGTNGN